MRLGMIGLGGIAGNYRASLRKLELPLTAVCDIDPARLQAIAQEAGIKNKLQIPRDEEERRGASKRVKFRFDNVQDESLPALLSWLDKAVTELPGMEVYSVSIRPLANQWVMNVTFARWERAG